MHLLVRQQGSNRATIQALGVAACPCCHSLQNKDCESQDPPFMGCWQGSLIFLSGPHRCQHPTVPQLSGCGSALLGVPPEALHKEGSLRGILDL